MRFSCGKSPSAKAADYQAFVDYMTNWHKVFLLLPRTVGEENGKKVCLWLTWAERKYDRRSGYHWEPDDFSFNDVSYREIKKGED